MTKVAICTVNWNNKKDTEEFLASIKKLDTSSFSVKTFVVSNQKLPNIDIIFKPHNRGTAGGYNDGIKAALSWGAKYFLLVNNDVVFSDKNLLPELISVLAGDPSIGAVSPKMYFAPGFAFYRERYSTKDSTRVLWYAGGHFDWANINSVHRGLDEVDKGRYDTVGPTGFVSGSAMLLPRRVFDQEIFWDEDLFAYYDDNDFQERVTRAGFKLFYNGRTSLFHKVSRTAAIGSPTTDYYTTRNRLIFGLRYAPIRTKLALFRQALTFLVSGRPMQKQGVWDFIFGKRGELGRPKAL
ncbi:glycosyltransferase family 2 protein [Candidatus Microgenomates bacterium]|nr:glycosyltransferase family 2 protein [Candidatus Microgenomates bacterium]